jgi:hypothetical protein
VPKKEKYLWVDSIIKPIKKDIATFGDNFAFFIDQRC